MFYWVLQEDNEVAHYSFDEQVCVLQRNGESRLIEQPGSGVLSVLLSHADAVVTPYDVYESDTKVTNPRTLAKAIHQLRETPYIGEHILQVGVNKRAVYSFLTNPQDSKLLLDRMSEVHNELYVKKSEDNTEPYQKETHTAQRHADTIKKVGVAAGAIAAAATTAYAVIRYVRKR